MNFSNLKDLKSDLDEFVKLSGLKKLVDAKIQVIFQKINGKGKKSVKKKQRPGDDLGLGSCSSSSSSVSLPPTMGS